MQQRTRDLDNKARFMRYVQKLGDGHWKWGGGHRRGQPVFGKRYADGIRREISTRRYSLALATREPVPDDAFVYATCEKRWCIAPDHLRVHLHLSPEEVQGRRRARSRQSYLKHKERMKHDQGYRARVNARMRRFYRAHRAEILARCRRRYYAQLDKRRPSLQNITQNMEEVVR